MRGKKVKELKKLIREVMPNLSTVAGKYTASPFTKELRRIKKVYKQEVIAGRLSYKQRTV